MDINLKNENMALESVYIVAEEVNRRRASLVVKNGRKINATGLRKDAKTIALLMYLYFLQGLPLGLASAITLLLSAKKVSFSDQGTFSFVFWPFSVKLLWAPIVDSIYVKRFGRRKSWLVTVQLLIGILMFFLASFCQNLVNNIQSNQGIWVTKSQKLKFKTKISIKFIIFI
jgi:MFS family permease